MKKIPVTLVLAGLLALASVAHGQAVMDAQNIRRATNAMEVVHNCEDAINFLRLVSDSGKTKPEYLLAMAKANDCKANNEQAIYYYDKYLEYNASNDSVKRRVAELKDDKTSKGKVANQERIARDLYKGAKHGKTKACLNDDYFMFGFYADIYTGGDNAPYKRAYNFCNAYGKPFDKNKLLFEFYDHIGINVNPQLSWFSQLYGNGAGAVTSVSNSFTFGVGASLAAVLVNKHNLALSVGPTLGFECFLMPDISAAYSTDVNNPLIIGLCTGLKSNLYLGEHVVFSLEYSWFLKSTYDNTISTGDVITPLNFNSIRLGITLRDLSDLRNGGWPYYY